MNEKNFLTPDQIAPRLPEIVPAYQEAFSKDPWYEVSKCVDTRVRCIGGLSSVALGETCTTCERKPFKPAYESTELITKFEMLGQTRPTAWYIESENTRAALAAIAWRAAPLDIARERYNDAPDMVGWMTQQLGDGDVVWLDEIFADSRVRATGNLANFRAMCSGFADQLGGDIVAFRTINPRLTRAATRDFGNNAAIFSRSNDVPDRRDFVIINMTEAQS